MASRFASWAFGSIAARARLRMPGRTSVSCWPPRSACLHLLARRELEVVHVHNIPDFLVFAGLVPRFAGTKVVLDVHDSVPETFAAKFSASSMFWKVLCLEERLSALVAHKVICVNHPQRDTLVARGIPGVEDVHLDERAGSADFQRLSAVDDRPKPATLQPRVPRTMASGSAWTCSIRAVAQLARTRVPACDCTCGDMATIWRPSSVWRSELNVERARLVQPKGLSARRAAGAPELDGYRRRRQPAKRGRAI